MRPVTAAVVLALASAALAADVPDSLTGTDLRKEHAARRAAVAAALPEGALAIIPAEPADPWATYTVRQDEDYGWLTGVDEPNGILLLENPRGEVLLLPPRDVRMEGWMGPRWYPGKEAEEGLGIPATEDVRKALETVKARLKKAKVVFVPRDGGAGEKAEKLFGDLLRESKVKIQDLRPVTGKLRLVKSAEEQARIRRASELSAEGHRRAMAGARAGMAEYTVQSIIEAAGREGGCRRQAYDSIVGSGPNACVLHYFRNRRILEDGEVVLVDSGAEFLGYACDVTRTWPVGAKFTDEQAAVYDAVLAAQAAGEAAAKPGATFKEITEACEKVLKEAGFAAGIQHGPCHWVGRGVHDPNGNAPLRPGSVFVIEPGLYYPGKSFGVRIEDTYLMKEDGTLDCLSRAAPKARAEVEALRAAAVR